MPILKTQDHAETKAALDRANYRHISTLKIICSDISVTAWGRQRIRPRNRDSSLPVHLQWPGRRDADHVFRHVEGTEETGPSYADAHRAIFVT